MVLWLDILKRINGPAMLQYTLLEHYPFGIISNHMAFIIEYVDHFIILSTKKVTDSPVV